MRILNLSSIFAILMLIAVCARAENPDNAVSNPVGPQPDVRQCAVQGSACVQHSAAYDRWCQDNQTECENQQAQLQRWAQCHIHPQQCVRARLERRLNKVLQGPCVKAPSNSDHCDKLRERLQQIQLEDAGVVESGGTN